MRIIPDLCGLLIKYFDKFQHAKNVGNKGLFMVYEK